MNVAIRFCWFVGTASVAFVSAADAVEVPFTEDFVFDSENWKDNASLDLTYVASGGPDNGSYVSTDLAFQDLPEGGLILLRGQDFFDSSDDAFVGDWLADGVGHLSAWVRHNAPEPLNIFTRLATQNNFPGLAVELPYDVSPNTWTQVDFDLDISNPLLTVEGPPNFYGQVLGALGNVQFGVDVTTDLAMDSTAYTFDLDKVMIRVPEPGTVPLLVIGLAATGLMWAIMRRG